MNRLISWCKTRWWILLGLLLLGLALGLKRVPASTPTARVTILQPPYKMPAQRIPLLDRFVPMTPGWIWLYRVRDFVFRRKIVNIYGDIVVLGQSPTSPLTSSQPAFSGTNGLKVWLLNQKEFKTVRAHLQQTPGNKSLARPRMSVGDEVIGSLSSGSTIPVNGAMAQIGFTADCFPRMQADNIDLTAIYRLTSQATNATGGTVAIQTNLHVGLRLQISKGTGVLLLDPGSIQTNPSPIALLIDPLQIQ